MGGAAASSRPYLLPVPAARAHPEDDLQAAVMDYLQRALPPYCIAHHSPGEGQRSKRAQRQLKRSGYQKGWPDIEIIWFGHPNVFIELKAPGRHPDADQRAMHKRLAYCGCTVLLCRTPEAVETELRALGLPLRARIAA